jgi:hypothetical protein
MSIEASVSSVTSASEVLKKTREPVDDLPE